MRIRYSPQSIDDLKRLREFIEVKNPAAAKRIASSIITGINQLRMFPYMGVQVGLAPKPELVRDLIIGNYIVRYLIRADEISILRLWHHKELRS